MDEEIAAHVQELVKIDGKRPDLFNGVEIPTGWVATTEVPKDFWEKCKVPAIPMKAVKLLGFFPSQATLEAASCIAKYGNQIIFVLIPDEEAIGGYSGGPILLEDLERDPEKLLDESLDLIGKDETLSDAKRHCAMLLLGWCDTK